MAFTEWSVLEADQPLCCGLAMSEPEMQLGLWGHGYPNLVSWFPWRERRVLGPLPCCQQEASWWWWQSGALCPCLQQAGEEKPSSNQWQTACSLLCLYGLSTWYVKTAVPSAVRLCDWRHWRALLRRVSLVMPCSGPSLQFDLIALALTSVTPLAHELLCCSCVGTLWNPNQASSRISIALFWRRV